MIQEEKNSLLFQAGRFQNVMSISDRLKSSFFKNITSKMPSLNIAFVPFLRTREGERLFPAALFQGSFL